MAAVIVLWFHFIDISSHPKVPQYKSKKIGQAFLNNILAFQMPCTFILAWRPILLNIIRNGVFSKAGLQIQIKIPAIDKFTQMNYSKTQYIAIKWNLVPFFTVYIMANSLPSTEYWAVRHRSQYLARQCTVSRVVLLLPPNLSWGKGGATRSLVGRQRVARVSYPCIIVPQEGQSPLLDTCKKHYSPEITCTRSGPIPHPGECLK